MLGKLSIVAQRSFGRPVALPAAAYPDAAYRSTGASTDTPPEGYFLTVTAAGLAGADVPADGANDGVAATFVAGPMVKPSACNRSTVLPPMAFHALAQFGGILEWTVGIAFFENGLGLRGPDALDVRARRRNWRC